MDGPSPSILVVDDSDDLRRLIVFALESDGFTVTSVANGRDALDQIAIAIPALIVLDLMLPVMSGLQVLAEVKRRPETARVPVLIITGTMTFERDVVAAGAAALLRKPFDGMQLTETIRRLLAQAG